MKKKLLCFVVSFAMAFSSLGLSAQASDIAGGANLQEEVMESNTSGDGASDETYQDQEGKDNAGKELFSEEENGSGDSGDENIADPTKDAESEKADNENTDQEKELRKEAAEKTEESADAFEYAKTVSGYELSLSAKPGTLPDDVETSIRLISSTEAGTDIEDIVKEKVEEGRKIIRIVTFDISFTSEGREIEPEDGSVNVAIKLSSSMEQTVEEAKENYEDVALDVYHIDAQERAQEVACQQLGDADIVFSAEEFSPYTVVLTAKAAADEQFFYYIFFNSGNQANGYMPRIQAASGEEITLPECSFTKELHDFTGWNTKPDGTGDSYKDGATVVDLCSEENGYVTLYAQWEFNPAKCDHSGYWDGNKYKHYTYKLTKPTKDKCGLSQKICEVCGKVLSETEIHPADTYELTDENGEKVTLIGWFDHDYARQVFDLTNDYRRENQLNMLQYNMKTQDASDLRALEAAVYFSHTRPNGNKWNTITSDWRYGGENIALGYQTPHYVMNAWKNSPGHNANLLYGQNAGSTPFQGLSVGVFHQLIFDGNYYRESISWSQNFTFYDLDKEIRENYRYNVKFDGNGATSGTMADINNCEYYSRVPLTANSFARTGYTFKGWNTKADGTGRALKDQAEVLYLTDEDGGTATLYAQWEPLVFNISYELAKGTNNEGNPATYTIESGNITLLDPTRKGYTFAGWYSDSGYTKKVTQISGDSQEDKTVYAKWTVNKYNVKFAGNGATAGTMKTLSGCKYGKAYDLAANSFVRTGYDFTGWNTKADGSGKAYADAAQIKNLSSKNGATVTLYAQWNAVDYNISYDLAGGINNEGNPATYNAASGTVTLLDPTRKGYTFGGWFTDKTYAAKVTEIAAGSTGNRTVYAKWTAIKYGVKYAGNGATSGTMKTKSGCKYGKAYNFDTNAFVRTGYEFTGWNSKADGSGKSYGDGGQFKNLSAVNGKTITVYAQWQPVVYSITYELNKGTNNASNPSSFTVESEEVSLLAPTRKGCTFAGWFADAEYKTMIASILSGSTGDRTVYAKWTANKYTVKFSGNGATAGTMKNLSGCKYGKTYTLAANTFAKTGYVFTGWNTKADGSGKTYGDGGQIKNLSAVNGKTITVYAQWQPVVYSITYELNKGTNNASNPSSFTVESEEVSLLAPTRKGCTFAGWFADAEYKTMIASILSGSTGDRTVYAKWTANKYTVKFSGNGATAGTMKNLSGFKYGKTYTLAANTFARTGYVFTGWNTKADGSGKTYADAANIKNLSSKSGATVTLYAQWEQSSKGE